jgi:hypothetical protein
MYVTAITAQTPKLERRLISSAIWLISMRIMPTPLGNASPSAVDSHANKKPSRILAVCVTVFALDTSSNVSAFGLKRL